MTSPATADLRDLVAQVVREVVQDLASTGNGGNGGSRTAPGAGSVGVAQQSGPQPTGPLQGTSRTRVETVRITGDADLHRFTLRILDLFENPKTREDLRAGRLTFALAGGVAAPAAHGAVDRVEQGAVTERRVAAAAEAGARLVLGRKAVLTPLAREKARALGVPVEKER